MAALMSSVICLTGCEPKIIYRSSDQQVFLFPAGTHVIAPKGGYIRTHEAGRPKKLVEAVIGYDGAIISDGYLLRLYRKARVEPPE